MEPFEAYRPTVAWDVFWQFAAERQRIFWARARGEVPPWTSDPILARFKFTNAYRASDRTSQYLIRNVLYAPSLDASPSETFFRVLLFKLFNKPSTWEYLEGWLGATPSWRSFRFDDYAKALDEARANGLVTYSSAYMMTGSGGFGEASKHANHLRLLEQMMKSGAPERIFAAPVPLHAAYHELRTFPMLGTFTAFQYAIDLDYSALTPDDEAYFVVAGPGARDGVAKCFEAPPGHPDHLFYEVAEHQDAEFRRRGLDWQPLPGRPLQPIDVQNLFCEVAKYTRVSNPEIRGVAPASIGHKGSDRPKQLFRPREALPVPYYPPKWGINAGVAAKIATPREE